MASGCGQRSVVGKWIFGLPLRSSKPGNDRSSSSFNSLILKVVPGTELQVCSDSGNIRVRIACATLSINSLTLLFH